MVRGVAIPAKHRACLRSASTPDVPFCAAVQEEAPVVLALRSVPPRLRMPPSQALHALLQAQASSITAPCRGRRTVTDHQPDPTGGTSRTSRGGVGRQRLPSRPGRTDRVAVSARSCTVRCRAGAGWWPWSGKRWSSRALHRPRTSSPPIRPCTSSSLAQSPGEMEAAEDLKGRRFADSPTDSEMPNARPSSGSQRVTGSP